MSTLSDATRRAFHNAIQGAGDNNYAPHEDPRLISVLEDMAKEGACSPEAVEANWPQDASIGAGPDVSDNQDYKEAVKDLAAEIGGKG